MVTKYTVGMHGLGCIVQSLQNTICPGDATLHISGTLWAPRSHSPQSGCWRAFGAATQQRVKSASTSPLRGFIRCLPPFFQIPPFDSQIVEKNTRTCVCDRIHEAEHNPVLSGNESFVELLPTSYCLIRQLTKIDAKYPRSLCKQLEQLHNAGLIEG